MGNLPELSRFKDHILKAKRNVHDLPESKLNNSLSSCESSFPVTETIESYSTS